MQLLSFFAKMVLKIICRSRTAAFFILVPLYIWQLIVQLYALQIT